MASVSSNYQNVARAYMGLTRALSPRRVLPGGRRLGDEQADTVAEAVRHRTEDQQDDPDGKPLPSLSPPYKRNKVRHGYSPLILKRTGEMLQPIQLRGRVTIGQNLLVLAAGIDDRTRQLVDWNTRGNKAQNRPPRRFYELGKDGAKAVDSVNREAVASAIQEARRA